MKGDLLVLDAQGGRTRAAWLRDGRLQDLLIDPDDDRPRPGAIFRAVCDRPVKGQGGMFLRLPNAGSAWHRNAKGLSPGQALTVQVTGWAEPGKAVPVTDRVLVKSRFAIATPGAPGVNVARSIREDETRDRLLSLAHDVLPFDRGANGLILRSAAAAAPEAEVAEDVLRVWEAAAAILSEAGAEPAFLLDGPDAHDVARNEWPEAAVSRDWALVADDVEALRSPRVPLGAVTLYVEPTRAFVAVDVNTPEGGAGGLRANIAAVREVPRQLRLRGLGGQVVLDLAPMAKKDRRGVEAALRAALRDDPVETSIIGWTPLGHLELTRRRERLPLELPT